MALANRTTDATDVVLTSASCEIFIAAADSGLSMITSAIEISLARNELYELRISPITS